MSFVNVAIRIKPPLTENYEDNCLDVIDGDPPAVHIPEKQQTYSFDKVFDGNTNQNEIFKDVVAPLIEKAILGYNCTVFAYGQTGTGKTYTMGSDLKELNGENAGIIKRVFEFIFAKTSCSKNLEVEVSINEIYQEKVYDLLGSNKKALTVKGFNIIDSIKVKVDNLNSVKKLLFRSCKRRHTGETKQNSWSSRSHAIFTIFLNVKNGTESRCAKLNLVDLAGCESVKKTGTQDNQFNEAVKINMGLLSIGQVINALSSNKACIPYRESMITRILQDSLNKQNYITLIACISPNITDVHETVQTLEFALKAKKLKNRPELSSILMECPRSVPSKYRNTALYDLKTPMKRPNQILHTSTSVKRPRLNQQTKNAIFSENISMNPAVNSDIISPIAKVVLTKLEDRLPQSADFIRCTKLYDTMRQLIKEEVHNLTNNVTYVNPTPKSRREIRKTLLPLKENQLPIFSSPIDNDKINDALEDELSLIENVSNNETNLSGIIPHQENDGDDKENNLNEGCTVVQKSSSPQFKIPQLPYWVTAANTNKTEQSIKNANSFAFSTPIIREIGSSLPKRRSVRLTIPKNDTNLLINKMSNDENESIEQDEQSPSKSDSLSSENTIHTNQNLSQPRRSLRLSMKVNSALLHKETNSLLELSKNADKSVVSKNSDMSSVIVTKGMENFKPLRKSIRQSILKNTTVNNNVVLLEESNYDQFSIRKSLRKSVRITQSSLRKRKSASSSSISTDVSGGSSYENNESQRKNRKHKFSLRKQHKEDTNSELSNISIQRPSNVRKSLDIIDTSQEDILDENTLRTFPVFARRRSIRLSKKQSQSIVICNLMETSHLSYNSPRKSLSKEEKVQMLKNNILKILNKGSIRELSKLHTIGIKTAQQILLYRQLNGPYKNIMDLKSTLVRGRSFARFMIANCLNFDNATSNEY